MKKAEILYPCEWSYRIIGLDKSEISRDVKVIMADREFSLSESNKKGKYISMNLKLRVETKQERNLIFDALKSSSAVTMVI